MHACSYTTQSSTRRAFTRSCKSKTVVCKASHASKPNKTFEEVVQKTLISSCQGLAVASLLFASSNSQALAASATLGDVFKQDFAPIAAIDSNKDGFVTKQEFLDFAKVTGEEEYFPLPNEPQLDFTMRVFDLNQDGKLGFDELLTSIALDTAVGDDETVTDPIFKAFDKNNDGAVSLSEFKVTIPDLGPHGEELKEYIFTRENQLTSGNSNFDAQQLTNAVVMLRNAVLGY